MAARVYIVDDHPLLRNSLTSLLNQQTDMEVCGEADSAAEAITGLKNAGADVVVLDLSLQDMPGLELIKLVKAKWPDIGIVVLSMHDEKLYAERCLRAGARAYVMKRESTRRIVFAIREVLAGRVCFSEALAASFAVKFVGGRQEAPHSPIEALSDRELEVFQLLGQGMETRQIAASLNVSIKTVQAYCARIKTKLHLSTASELLREAVRWNDSNSALVRSV
jgi:DNA-binding NarL/FixJ family response regulator